MLWATCLLCLWCVCFSHPCFTCATFTRVKKMFFNSLHIRHRDSTVRLTLQSVTQTLYKSVINNVFFWWSCFLKLGIFFCYLIELNKGLTPWNYSLGDILSLWVATILYTAPSLRAVQLLFYPDSSSTLFEGCRNLSESVKERGKSCKRRLWSADNLCMQKKK